MLRHQVNLLVRKDILGAMALTCPVCGFGDLSEAPYDERGTPSLEICPSCGFQFGFDDGAVGITHGQWRQEWIDGGMKWWSGAEPPPPGWDPLNQLARLEAHGRD